MIVAGEVRPEVMITLMMVVMMVVAAGSCSATDTTTVVARHGTAINHIRVHNHWATLAYFKLGPDWHNTQTLTDMQRCSDLAGFNPTKKRDTTTAASVSAKQTLHKAGKLTRKGGQIELSEQFALGSSPAELRKTCHNMCPRQESVLKQ